MISVIVPAHNEENYIDDCLKAIRCSEKHCAEKNPGSMVEIIVVLNRCSDKTEQIARDYDAVCIEDDSRCLSRIRNKGVAAATYPIIVTCDADSRLHPNTLSEVVEKITTGSYVGGGTKIVFDRQSCGIKTTEKLLDVMIKLTGISCGAFWTTRKAFDVVGGFNEDMPMGEDVEFAKRLMKWGRAQGLYYTCLQQSPLLTSSRKFDHYGDWSPFFMMIRDARKIYRSMKKRDTEFVDEYFYDFNDRIKK